MECRDSYEEQKEYLKQKLKRNLKKDLLRRSTSFGPHKDDLGLCVEGVDIRHYGSQGQQRTAALSLKLAEIRLIKEEAGISPVLLLDDVLSDWIRTGRELSDPFSGGSTAFHYSH